MAPVRGPRLEGRTRDLCCTTQCSGGDLDLVFWRPWKSCCYRNRVSPSLSFPTAGPSPAAGACGAGGRRESVIPAVAPQGCLAPYALFFLPIYFHFFLSNSQSLVAKRKRLGKKEGTGERSVSGSSCHPCSSFPSAFSCSLIIHPLPSLGEETWLPYLGNEIKITASS